MLRILTTISLALFLQASIARGADANSIIPNPIAPPIETLAPIAPTVQSTEQPTAPAPLKFKKPADLESEFKKTCDAHFAGIIQSELRAACESAGPDFSSLGLDLVRTRCRLHHGEEPRLVMACLIGTSVYNDLASGKTEYRKRMQFCGDQYPAHTEIDAFLQESCLVGTYLPTFVTNTDRATFEICNGINPERSFIGPCAVGLSFAQEGFRTAGIQNKICEQYFDHRQFHIGYRSCLAARGLGARVTDKPVELMKACANLIANPENDTERAACIVGADIFRRADRTDDLTRRFLKCGDMKVSYQDRDFLACLTAASLVDLSDKANAGAGCKEIYKNNKSKGRGNCLESIAQF